MNDPAVADPVADRVASFRALLSGRVTRSVPVTTALLLLVFGCRGGVTGPEEATRLEVEPASVTLTPGDTVQMKATPVDDQGNPVRGYTISWTSGDTTVASVDGDGTVTGLSAGSTRVTARATESSQASGDISGSLQASHNGNGPDNGKGKKKGLKKHSDVTVEDSGLITDLEPVAYEKDTLETGDSVYVDRAYSIDGVPADYEGWRYVRTANDDKNVTSDSAVTFTLEDTARVALAYDERATTLPDWLRDWTATGDTLRTSDVDHLVYTRLFLPGDVTLGGNMSGGAEGAESMYVFFAARSDSAPDDGGSDTTTATGSLEVITATTGDSLDSDGYTVSVDGGSGQAIGINDTTAFADLSAEDHSVELSGVASNCSVSGSNPRTVSVTENDTTSTTFDVSCEAPAVDSVDVSPDSAAIPVGDSVQFSAAVYDSAGNELSEPVTWASSDTSVATVDTTGLATGRDSGSAYISATADGVSDSAFLAVDTTSSGTGALEVVTATSGDSLDSDGYTVSVDGGSGQAIGINDTTTLSDLTAEDHTVELSGVASNCSVSGSNPRTVSVTENDTVTTSFDVTCEASDGSGSGSITDLTWACDSRITDSTGESDLWPITWADDGHQYTAWGDGDGFGGTTKASYGIAQIQGEPTSYTASDRYEDSEPDGNGKLAGAISIGGDLYFWKNMQDGTGERRLFKSTDKGETDPVDTGVVFPKDGVGPETFIQMGQDHGAAPDSYVYAEIADFNGTGGEPIYLMRAPTSGLETQSNWEVFSGTPSSPAWSTDFTQRTAIHQESGSTSKSYKTTITYIPPVEQYVLIWPMDGNSYASWKMLVADNPYGPYTEIASYSDWCGDSGESTGQLHKHIAPKWIGNLADGSLDFWLVWSGLGSAPADEFNIRKGSFNVE